MPVICTVEAGFAELTMEWPHVRNAFGAAEARELRTAIQSLMDREDCCAVVLSAAGSTFCAGGNLRMVADYVRAGEAAIEQAVYGEFQGLFRTIHASPIPILMAVDGPAIGFGADLALAGDVTFVGAEGWLSQGWMAAGLIPATGGALYVARRGGPQAVWRFLTQARLNGPDAEGLGIAVSVPQAREAAIEIARKLSAMPRAAVSALRELIGIEDFEEHLETALKYQKDFLMNPEFLKRVEKLLS